MNRKTFLRNTILGGAGLAMMPGKASVGRNIAADNFTKNAPPFKMKFSPDFNVFKFEGSLEQQIEKGYELGFRAWENTWLMRRTEDERKRIKKTIDRLGMEFGQFVGTATFTEVTFAGNDEALRQKVLDDVRKSVEVAKQMNTKYIHNVLGLAHPKLPKDYQMANAIELLKRVAAIYEPHDLVMVMETMNHKINHPGVFLYEIPQAYVLAKAVNSPSVKMLFDAYHVQIQEGNLIPNLDHAWDEIAYIQVGDTPGRREPGTGEIHFKNLLQHIHDKGYRGFVGLEHGLSKEGEEGKKQAIQAYRDIDPS